MRRRPFSTSIALALVCLTCVLATGCSGSGDTEPMVMRLTNEWTSGYCLAALDLLVFLVDTRDGTKGGAVTPKFAGEILTLRTGEFADAIEKLGRPDTAVGDISATTTGELARQEQEHADRVAEATGGENPVGTLAEQKQLVHDEANAGLKAITDTTKKLGEDDEVLGDAIAASSDCAELGGDMRRHYPG